MLHGLWRSGVHLARRRPWRGCRSPVHRTVIVPWLRRSAPGPVSRRKWSAPRAVLARPWRSRTISTSPVSAATARAGDSHPGVAMATGALLARNHVGLADGGVQVNGQRLVAVRQQDPRQQFPAHPIQLATLTPPEAAQKGPQGGWRLHRTSQHPCGAAGAPRRRHGRSRRRPVPATSVSILSPRVGSTRRISQVNMAVHQFTQTQMVGQGNREGAVRHWPPDGGRRPATTGQGGCVVASFGCSSFWVGFLFQKPLSPKPGALSHPLSTPPASSCR